MTRPNRPDLPDVPWIVDADVRAGYGVDASFGAQAPTDFEVVRARDEADVVEVLRYAAATGTPIVPQGGRTGLVGGATATPGAIVLSTLGLNDIVDVDPVQGLAVAGPGVIVEEFKKACAAEELFYPPDPASAASCTLGGNVATNAGGLCCVKYGVTADYIAGLRVVLPGGAVMTTGRRTAKNSVGPDLTGLLVGSEGTIGVIMQVVTKVIPAPDPALTALGTFPTLTAAAEAIVALRRDPHPPCLLEFLDEASIAAIQSLADYGFPQGCAAALLVQADRPGHVTQDLARYAAMLTQAGADEVAVADDAQEADALLAGRRALHVALEAQGPQLIEDMCVPIRALPQLVTRGREITAAHGIEVTMSGHGGDGNLHPSLGVDPRDPDQVERGWRAFGEMVDLALELGGTLSGEHGVGRLKAPFLRRQFDNAQLQRLRAIKAVFDPAGLMNPGASYSAP
ncbi:glycolate oxidase [Kineosphaera limosa]|uniref:Putative FAD-linked oxidase n=1 Tax=Kineosphaera limosa NBRC 100340 TaxID=1184609 RepID=K6XDG8_9MICO|nr:FAD-linked oxidase C-terminal domain-containing protein [Kineosphaera limosa]NYE02765.1 glycolate oxidase [Kineosphaera limosa]GAB96844.1 putative FAD-linked oxidase [Kineosphaera limosa NBRC 100340]